MKSTANRLVNIQPAVKSSESSIAQSSVLLRAVSTEYLLASAANRFIFEDSSYPVDFKYLVFIMLVSGCRISEVLNIRDCDISGNYRIVIHGSKGSNNRVIYVPELPGGKLNIGNSGFKLFSVYSRFYVYRVLKKHGMYISKEGNKNLAVTHSFRNVYASEVHQIVGSSKEKSEALGHKSQKSREYYERQIFK